MPKTPIALLLVLAPALLAGCAGDDTVNPLPPPEAGTNASKDATAGDGATPHDGGADGEAVEAEAGEKDAAADATADAPSADATPDAAAAAGPDATADSAPDAG